MKLSSKQYAQILDEATHNTKDESALNLIVQDFVELVSRDGKISKVSDIMQEFTRLYNKRHNIVDVNLETADMNNVSFPDKIHNKIVNLKVKENKSLIGGSIIKIGDYFIDNSVIGKIHALKN